MQTYIFAPSGIRTHDPRVWVVGSSTCRRPHNFCGGSIFDSRRPEQNIFACIPNLLKSSDREYIILWCMPAASYVVRCISRNESWTCECHETCFYEVGGRRNRWRQHSRLCSITYATESKPGSYHCISAISFPDFSHRNPISCRYIETRFHQYNAAALNKTWAVSERKKQK